MAGIAVALAAVGLAGKVVTGYLAARRAGLELPGRIRAGTVLIARGEFSIVIAGLAVAAGLNSHLGPLAAAYVFVLAVAGPLAARAAARASRWAVAVQAARARRREEREQSRQGSGPARSPDRGDDG